MIHGGMDQGEQLYEAADEGDLAAVERLLRAGGEVNWRNGIVSRGAACVHPSVVLFGGKACLLQSPALGLASVLCKPTHAIA